MAQINACLRRTFTIFNILFAIVGGVILCLALLAQVWTNFDGEDAAMGSRTTGLIVFYVVGSIIMVIAILGAYGAHKESKAALIVFLVCMVIGCLVMFRIAVSTAIVRPQLEEKLEENFHQAVPLDRASPEIQKGIRAVQSALHCCGLFSYKDWEDSVPESCNCNPDTEEGKCQAIGYNALIQRRFVYSQPCFPVLMRYVQMGFDIVLGVFFTLAILALLGLILSSVMIHQLRYPDRPTVMLTVPAIFTAQPPKYQELHNPPPPY